MSALNSTRILRPEFFIITGFSGVPYATYYNIFLFICFASAVMGNLLIMSIIIVVHSLHTPKYMLVFNLAVADLGESAALIPSLVEAFIYTKPKITYEGCLMTAFSNLIFFCMQSITLTVLGYDRFVAICFPLRYHNIVTNTSIGIIVAVLWLFDVTFAILLVSVITTQVFCNFIIKNFYCAYGHVCDLLCRGIRLTYAFEIIGAALFYFLPMVLIGLSYISILLALFKIATWKERLKALKTCFSHIILVFVFYIPLITVDVLSLVIPISINDNTISTALSSILPTVLNPIVYSLSTAEIREFIKKMFKRNRTKTNIPAVSK